MRAVGLIGAWALALAVLLCPAVGCAREIAGPQLDAAALRAARGAAPQMQLRLDFDLHRGDAAPTPLTALIAADYVDIVEPGRETLYDFRLRRRLNIDRANRAFANFSLYGDVAFRRFELSKRMELGELFVETSHEEEPPLPLQRFWLESDVGLASSAKPLVIAHETIPDGAVRFRLDGEEVALFAPAPQPVPAELQQSFARFLRLRLPIHPDILAAIALDGRLPQRLVLVGIADGERRPTGLVLRSVELSHEDYPLPARFEPLPLGGETADAETSSLRGLLPAMLDAVSGRSRIAPRPLADYKRAADQALAQKRGFAAMLLMSEAALQYGAAAGDCAAGLGWAARCRRTDEINRALADDPRATLFYKAQTAEPGDPAAAVAAWQGLKRDDVANGYVVDAFLADRLSAARRRQEAMGAFALALAGNPYLVGVYKELGDHFLRASRTDLAWICYDLGRALPGRAAEDALTLIDALEAKLASTYPAFF
jgi:hypothetical protein